jgi:hypothetical protein
VIQEISNRPRYTIAVCKGSALLDETKALLRAWRPEETIQEFSARVLRDDLLGKSTAYRNRDIVRRVFARRLLLPDTKPAQFLKHLLSNVRSAKMVSDLVLVYAARQDDLLRDVIVKLYWPSYREGRISLGTSSVIAFLKDAEADGRIPEPWSEQVKIKVARGLIRALIDFGLLKQIGRRLPETIHFQPAEGSIVYLAYDLHSDALTDAAVTEHRDWALFGFEPAQVRAAIDRLSGQGWWLAQMAGSIVRIAWKYKNMTEVVDALAG